MHKCIRRPAVMEAMIDDEYSTDTFAPREVQLIQDIP